MHLERGPGLDWACPYCQASLAAFESPFNGPYELIELICPTCLAVVVMEKAVYEGEIEIELPEE